MLFLAAIFKTTDKDLWISLLAASIALCISMLVNLFILPERREQLFLDNFANHLQQYNLILAWLDSNLNQSISMKEKKKFINEKRKNGAVFLTSNQVISGELISRNFNSGEIFQKLLILEYNLSKAIGILSDNICNIFHENYDQTIEKELTNILHKCLHRLHHIGNLIKINKKKPEVSLPDKIPSMQSCLKELQHAIFQYDISEHKDIFYFYSCYTGLEHYWLTLLDIGHINAARN